LAARIVTAGKYDSIVTMEEHGRTVTKLLQAVVALLDQNDS
jgi:hypothetical protein